MKTVKRTDGDFFTKDEIEILKKQLKDVSELDFQRFLIVCKRTGLDPFSRQIYGRAQGVREQKPDGKWGWAKEKTLVIITSIDGLRSIAEQSGEYRGQTAPEWYYLKEGEGKEGWYDVAIIKRDQMGNPLTKIDAARVGIKRAGFDAPVYGVANFDSFAVYAKEDQDEADRKAGKKPSWILSTFWKKMPEHQLAKCAEAQGIRKAFPQLAQGLYIEEEIRDPEQDDIVVTPPGSGPLPADMKYVEGHSPEERAATATKQGPVKPEKKEEPKQPEPKKPAPSDDDKSPFGEDPTPAKQEKPAETKKSEKADDSWKDYQIRTITIAKFAGKKLSELTAAQIKDLQEGWVEKYADKIAKNPDKVKEAAMITAAHKALNK